MIVVRQNANATKQRLCFSTKQQNETQKEKKSSYLFLFLGRIFAGQGFTLLGNIADTHANIQNLLVKHGGSKSCKGI